jgi:acetolactate synthase-1/2/3 large subunit
MVKGITKYAVTVTDPNTIRYHLEKALYLTTYGRPGPCWLDIPVDVQAAMIDETSLKGFDAYELERIDTSNIAEDARKVINKMASAERPVMIGSTGIRLAGAMRIFRRLLS